MRRISYTRRQVCQMGLSGLAGLTLLDLAGCGGSGGGPASETLQLSFWGPASRNKLTQAAIKAFHQEHSNINIHSWFADFSVYFNQLNTQIASGSTPDLIQMDMSYVAQYVNEHELLDLTSFVNDKTIDLSDFDQGMLKNSADNGVLYGISLGGNYECMIYDTTLIQEAGVGTPPTSWTWDQFATYAGQVSKALKSKGIYGSADASRAMDMFEIWVRQRGKELWTTDGKVAFTVDDIAAWFSFWDAMRKSGACASAQLQATVTGSGPSASLLAQGKSAFATGHSNQFSSFQTLSKHPLALQTVPTGSGPGNYLKPSMLMSISAKSKYAKDAANFINFLITNPKGVLAVEEAAIGKRIVIHPDMGRVIQDGDVVEGRVPVAGRAIGRVPLRETIEGVLELKVADNHVIDVLNHEIRANHARARFSANDRGVRWDIDHDLLRLILLRSAASGLQRPARHACAPPDRRVVCLEIGVERVAAGDIIRAAQGITDIVLVAIDHALDVNNLGRGIGPGIISSQGLDKLCAVRHSVHLLPGRGGPASGATLG